MKKKIPLLLAAAFLLCLTGCGKETAQANVPETLPQFTLEAPDSAVPTTEAVYIPPTPVRPAPEGNPDAEDLLDHEKNCISVVYEASESGCIILPTLYEMLPDGQLSASSPDPVNPGNWPQITVQYDPDCTFVHAKFSRATYAVTYEDITWKDVEQGDFLIVYGEYDENDVLHAQKVYTRDWF